MTKSLWGGRFEKEASAAVLAFNSAENIQLDVLLISYDIAGSLAHVIMLKEQKILKAGEAQAILDALLKIRSQYDKGLFALKPELEDVHMNVEAAVTQLTLHGKKMHTARSRNDQVILDTRLYMRDKILEIASAIVELQKAFAAAAKKNEIMPAYTHTRIAQPISTAFWADAYTCAFFRDLDRLFELYGRVNQNPLGACACSGTSWNINRNRTAQLLGFAKVQENALDVVSSRGELEAELLSILSLVMVKLSRLSEELIWFSEKGFVAIPEEFTTGSSIMPQKKNADVLELIRGRAGRVSGNWIHILTALKGLPSGYNSDSQETKKALMEGIETTRAGLAVAAAVVQGLQFNEKTMIESLQKNFAQATRLADLLAQKGMPFREAHAATGQLVRLCENQGKILEELSPSEIKNVLKDIPLSPENLKSALKIQPMHVALSLKEIEAYEKKIHAQQQELKSVYVRLYIMAGSKNPER